MKRTLVILAAAALGACSSLPMRDAPSATHNSRIQHLVIHFTSEHFAESLRLLTQKTERPVSVHYLVPEPGAFPYWYRDLNYLSVPYMADFVVETLRRRGIPFVLLLAGGYARTAELTADLHATVHRVVAGRC